MSSEKFSKLLASCLVTCLCFEGVFFNSWALAKGEELEGDVSNDAVIEMQKNETEEEQSKEEDNEKGDISKKTRNDVLLTEQSEKSPENINTPEDFFQEGIEINEDKIGLSEIEAKFLSSEAEKQRELSVENRNEEPKDSKAVFPGEIFSNKNMIPSPLINNQTENEEIAVGEKQLEEEFSGAGLIINEVMIGQANSSKNEFIELFNNTEKIINLESWKLTKKTESGNESNLLSASKFKGQIEPGKYFVIKHPDFEDLKIYDATYSGSSYSISKNNSIVLYNSKGEVIDMLCWGARNYECGGPYFSDNPEDGFSLSRKESLGKKFAITSKATPGEKNVFPEKKLYSNLISFSEVVSNPEGIDKDNEWVEVMSEDFNVVDLSGWSIKNGSGKVFQIKLGQVESFGFFVIEIENSGSFSIRNSNERLFLLNPNGGVVSEVFISGIARSGLSYNNEGGGWSWSKQLTPGRKNLLNNIPNVSFKKTNKVYKNIYAEFDASKTKDSDGDSLKFKWDFGDGHHSYLKKTKHKYNKKGVYKVVLEVDDGVEKISKEMKVEVKAFPEHKVEIVRLIPNPKGRDSGNEIVSIRNYHKKKLNLKGYKLATGRNKNHLVNHPIYEDFVIKAKSDKDLVSGNICKFSLLNKSGVVALLYPDGMVADLIKYEKDSIADDEEYVLLDEENNHWVWTGANINDVGVSFSFDQQTNEKKESVLGVRKEISRFVSATKNEAEMICESAKKLVIENWKHRNKKMFILTNIFEGEKPLAIWEESVI